MPILQNHYVLAVPDADATAGFFIEKLGFRTEWRVERQWHAVSRDKCMIMLGSCPDAVPPSQLGDHSYFGYLLVDDVDALYAELCEKGLQASAPEDKPWGLREFLIRTPDGHRLMVGHLLAPRG